MWEPVSPHNPKHGPSYCLASAIPLDSQSFSNYTAPGDLVKLYSDSVSRVGPKILNSNKLPGNVDLRWSTYHSEQQCLEMMVLQIQVITHSN